MALDDLTDPSNICGYTMTYLITVYRRSRLIGVGHEGHEKAVESALAFLVEHQVTRWRDWEGFTAHETLQLVAAFNAIRDLRFTP